MKELVSLTLCGLTAKPGNFPAHYAFHQSYSLTMEIIYLVLFILKKKRLSTYFPFYFPFTLSLTFSFPFGWFFFFFHPGLLFSFSPSSSCSLISSFFLILYFFSTLSFPVPLMKVDNNLWIQVELHFWNCTLMLEPIKLNSEKWEKS